MIALIMEAASTSETLVKYQSVWCCNPQDTRRHTYHCENRRSFMEVQAEQNKIFHVEAYTYSATNIFLFLEKMAITCFEECSNQHIN